jgi:hypothetical protein
MRIRTGLLCGCGWLLRHFGTLGTLCFEHRLDVPLGNRLGHGRLEAGANLSVDLDRDSREVRAVKLGVTEQHAHELAHRDWDFVCLLDVDGFFVEHILP